MIPADFIESQVVAVISQIAHSDQGIQNQLADYTLRERQSLELDQAIARLDLQWQQGFIAEEYYLAQRKEVQNQLTQLRPFSKLELREVIEVLKKIKSQWTISDKVEQKRLLHRMLECVWSEGNGLTKLKLRPAIAYLAKEIPGLKIDEDGMIVFGDV